MKFWWHVVTIKLTIETRLPEFCVQIRMPSLRCLDKCELFHSVIFISFQMLCDTICILAFGCLRLVSDDLPQMQRHFSLLCVCPPSSSYLCVWRQTRTVTGLLSCPLESQQNHIYSTHDSYGTFGAHGTVGKTSILMFSEFLHRLGTNVSVLVTSLHVLPTYIHFYWHMPQPMVAAAGWCLVFSTSSLHYSFSGILELHLNLQLLTTTKHKNNSCKIQLYFFL